MTKSEHELLLQHNFVVAGTFPASVNIGDCERTCNVNTRSDALFIHTVEVQYVNSLHVCNAMGF